MESKDLLPAVINNTSSVLEAGTSITGKVSEGLIHKPIVVNSATGETLPPSPWQSDVFYRVSLGKAKYRLKPKIGGTIEVTIDTDKKEEPAVPHVGTSVNRDA
jgi:hypothetical protein